jgi:hypothetical protein
VGSVRDVGGAMDASNEWLKFAHKLIRAGAGLAKASSQHIPGNPFSDPKLLALLLLARTLSHMKSIIILMQADRVLEARILVRNCFENAFFAARFAVDGEKFLNEVLEDDRKRRNSQGKLLYENGLPVGENFRQFMKETKDWDKSKTIDVKSVASKGAIEGAYVFYTYLSQDAHPTTNTLSRYFTDHEDGPPEINFEPPVSEEDAQETMELCAVAALGVIVGVNDVIGTKMDWAPLADEFHTLQKKA